MTDFPSAPPPLGATAGAPASFGQRLFAYLIDAVVAIGFYVPGYILLIIGGVIGGAIGGLLSLVAFVVLLAGFGAIIYVMVVGQGQTGQTPGKRMQGIQLLGSDGRPVGAGMVFVRWILAGVLSFFCYIGHLWMLWDGEKKTLYDKILSNQVVAGPKGGITPIFPGGKPF